MLEASTQICLPKSGSGSITVGMNWPVAAGIWRWQSLSQAPLLGALAVLAARPLADPAIGAPRWRRWSSAASAVDTH
jgi:hypothetical protein